MGNEFTAIEQQVYDLAKEGSEYIPNVMAYCTIESGFNPAAYRFEPDLGEGSYGLMQLLLSTARDRGFSGDATKLYDPTVNIPLGLAQLAWIRKFLASSGDPSDSDVPAAFNSGVGNVLHGKKPAGYIARFNAARTVWEGRLTNAGYSLHGRAIDGSVQRGTDIHDMVSPSIHENRSPSGEDGKEIFKGDPASEQARGGNSSKTPGSPDGIPNTQPGKSPMNGAHVTVGGSITAMLAIVLQYDWHSWPPDPNSATAMAGLIFAFFTFIVTKHWKGKS